MRKNKVLFFGSGDFPYFSFVDLITNENYDVAGLVTTDYKSLYGYRKMEEIAVEANIPVFKPKDVEDPQFLDAIEQLNADIFCVISYKYLPYSVISKCRHYAFNIHASVLPFLRGAAPINWAIRYGFRQTGLTSFLLSDKIDCGDIIHNDVCNIEDGEDYDSLFNKLSCMCVNNMNKTLDKLSDALSRNAVLDTIKQITYSNTYQEILHAPKLNKSNSMRYVLDAATTEGVMRYIRSFPKAHGATLCFRTFRKGKNIWEQGNEVRFKVYEAEEGDFPFTENLKLEKDGEHTKSVFTDGKKLLLLRTCKSEGAHCISIKKIQLPGKKILDVEEFIKGFQYLHDKNSFVTLA